MPWLDVTEVLTDPNFSDTFMVLRRGQTVNDHGVAVEQILSRHDDVPGVVTPTGSNSLTRDEAFESQSKSIQIITTFRLRSTSKDHRQKNYLPDLVWWSGDTYIVANVEDFSRFGAGMVVVELTSIDYNIAPILEQAGTDCG